MASLQARHQERCAIGRTWTTYVAATRGCTCSHPGPTYYVILPRGKSVKRERVGKSRRQAKRALNQFLVTMDEGLPGFQRDITFAEWGEEWLAGLECKPSTARSYLPSLRYANEVFGEKQVRHVTPVDIRQVMILMKDRDLSASTRAKHLRTLGTCFNSAVSYSYAGYNPVARVPKAEKPRQTHREAAYFETGEIAPIIQALEPGVHQVLIETAFKTGMRLGELIALRWQNVHLGDQVLRVRETRSRGETTTTKSNQARDVDITADLVELLGRWWGECEHPPGDRLVFPGPGAGGYLDSTVITQNVFYPAMERAGISRGGPNGERRVFHSIRHSYAKRALEVGAQLSWLSRQLGHSTITVTVNTYGHWERSERRRQAALLETAFEA